MPTLSELEQARQENAGEHIMGLRDKYRVMRIGGTPGKHEDCPYFVLDLRHDVYGRLAAKAYADACDFEYPRLAQDLRATILAEENRVE